jgi:hypothetical protein
MTRYAPLWQQAGSYAAALDRLLMQALWPSGGASGGAVSASATTMQVTAAPGFAAVPLQSGQGCALCRWDANEVPTLAAGSAQQRIDLVIVQVRDNALDAGANNDFIVTSVTGVPAASNPAAPATPTNAFALAQVLIPGGSVANLSGATVVDRRLNALAPSGVGGLIRSHGWLGTAQGMFGSTWTPLTFDTFAYGGQYWSGGVFTVPPNGAGDYLLSAMVMVDAAPTRLSIALYVNGVAKEVGSGQLSTPSAAFETKGVTAIRALADGDRVTFNYFVTAPGSINAAAGEIQTWVSLRRLPLL